MACAETSHGLQALLDIHDKVKTLILKTGFLGVTDIEAQAVIIAKTPFGPDNHDRRRLQPVGGCRSSKVQQVSGDMPGSRTEFEMNYVT